MNKKRRLSLSLSLFLLLLSHSLSFFLLFSLAPLLSLFPMLMFSTLSHTNAPTFTRHHRIQRQEGERNLHCPEKNVNIQEEKRKCAKLSLSLISLPSSSSLSSSHSLSLLFMSAYMHIRANALLKEGCQCLNILLISSRTQSPLIVSVCLSRV